MVDQHSVWDGNLERQRERVREMEKPNRSGYFVFRRSISVDLPAPDGPETTIGRRESFAAVVM